MHRASLLICMLAVMSLGAAAGEKKEAKPEYTEFSRLIQQVVVKQLPKEFEDASGWGHTIPVPPKLLLPGLRKFVKVGDKLELPHGAWRRFKGKFENPDKDLKITVKDFKALDDKTYRIVLDVDAKVLCHGEWQQWQKGLLLVGAEGTADANITAAIVCDVGVSLNTEKFPPELKLDPKVTQLGLELVDFNIRNAPVQIKGEKGDSLRNDMKELLRALVKASEPLVMKHANQAIAQSLKDGKGAISAESMLKALPPPKK